MTGYFYTAILFYILCLFRVTSGAEDDYVVTVTQGQLRGKQATTYTGFNYYSFQGIPYAKPPLGNLRFKGPQQADSWEGIRDALEEGSACPQRSDPGNEDCLFVNVYTPQLPPSDYLRPVAIWIHGGGLTDGSGGTEMGQSPDYFLQEDIVVVTMNYRLGALGFLSLQGTEVSSNNGLKDQAFALRWIKQNIEQFGGDSEKMTIWGESAGGTSVHYQILSPLSEGLFQQVISESGTGLVPSLMYPPGFARREAFRLGETLGLTTDDTTELIEFLRNASFGDIVNSTTANEIQFKVDIEYEVSSGDEAFLPEDPEDILLQGKFHNVSLLIGTVGNEGLFNRSLVDQDPENAEYIDTHFETVLPWNIKGNLTEKAATIKKFYFGEKKLAQETLLQFVDFETDFNFLYPADHAVKLQAALATLPIYYFRFTFDGTLGKMGGDSVPGVGHGTDLSYLFYTSGLEIDEESPEMKTLERTVKLWTNFVKFGNPTPSEDVLLQNVTWKPFTQLDHYYLDIGNDLILRRDIEYERMSFVEDIYSS